MISLNEYVYKSDGDAERVFLKNGSPYDLRDGDHVVGYEDIGVVRVCALVSPTGVDELSSITSKPLHLFKKSAPSIGYVEIEDYGFHVYSDRLQKDSPIEGDGMASQAGESLEVGGTHYQTAIEPWDFIFANGIDFDAGNAIKYLCRYKEKNGAEDIRKAISYCRHILKTQYGEEE